MYLLMQLNSFSCYNLHFLNGELFGDLFLLGLPEAPSLTEGMDRMEEMSKVDKVGRLCLSPRMGVTLRERRGVWAALGDSRDPWLWGVMDFTRRILRGVLKCI